MTDATVKVTLAWDFSGMADAFRHAADAMDALQESLNPAAPVAPVTPAATMDESPEIPADDPQGP